MTRIIVSRVLAAGLGVALVVGLEGCKRESGQVVPKEKHVVVALDGNPVTLDPVAMTEVLSAAVGGAAHAPLMRVDPDGKLVPVLADNITVAADGLSAVISLHPGATFWSGQPVTAADVEFSLNRLQKSSSALKWVCNRISGFEQRNDRELLVKFSKPEPDFAKLVANLQCSIVRAGCDKLTNQPFATQIEGAGAFVPTTNFEPGVAFTFRANPGFPRRGNVDVLTFSIIPDQQRQIEALRSGRADIVRARGPALAETCVTGADGQLRPKPEFGKAVVVQAPASELVFMVFRYADSKLGDIPDGERTAFIGALSGKVERSQIARILYLGMADPAVGVVPPAMLAAAQSAPAGAPGFKLEPTRKLTLLSANDPSSRQIAGLLQPQFKDVGLEFDLRLVELSKLAESVIKGDFEAVALWFEMPVAGVGPWAMFFEEKNPYSVFGQALPGIKEKVQAARGVLDETARNKAYAEVVADINSRQQAWLPLISRRTVLLVNQRVGGVFIDVCGTPVWSFLKVNE